MAISKFTLACVAAILAGGATAGLAEDPFSPVPTQVSDERPVTPIAAIARPVELFRGVTVRLVSNKPVGRVRAVDTDTRGHATRIQVALSDMPGTAVWVDQSDLVYSRAQDAIIAHDIHAPSMTVAAR